MILLPLCLPAASQVPAPSPPAPSAPKALAYDVVIIKPNVTGSGRVSIGTNDDVYTAINVPLKTLLQEAYDIKESLIAGIPAPLANARFDVTAKILDAGQEAISQLTAAQRQAMLVAVLTERFHLQAHLEARSLPVYELIVVPPGPRFQPSAAGTLGGGLHLTAHETRELRATNLPIAALATALSHQLDRTVLDKTGLAGAYDLTLTWTPDETQDPPPNSPPGLFTALQEQLGLKLRPAKGPVDTLMVDRIAMPTEN